MAKDAKKEEKLSKEQEAAQKEAAEKSAVTAAAFIQAARMRVRNHEAKAGDAAVQGHGVDEDTEAGAKIKADLLADEQVCETADFMEELGFKPKSYEDGNLEFGGKDSQGKDMTVKYTKNADGTSTVTFSHFDEVTAEKAIEKMIAQNPGVKPQGFGKDAAKYDAVIEKVWKAHQAQSGISANISEDPAPNP